MTSDTVPAPTLPASRLRARPINTCNTAPGKTSAKALTTKRAASLKSSTVRPRTASAAPVTPATTNHSLTSTSITRRTRGNVKPVAPGRTPVSSSAAAAADENGATALTSIPTNTSHLSGRGGVAVQPTAAALLVKMSSRIHSLTNTVSAHRHITNSGRVSRLDSVCSSLPGSSDRGSVHRLRVPSQHPPVPPLSVMPRPVPLARAATAECVMRSARQQPAVVQPAERGRVALATQPVELEGRARTQSAHAVVAPLSPRRTPAAPASRVSSVNSRLAEACAAVANRAPRTRVVRTAGKRSASSNSDLGATASAPPLAASTAFAAVPPRAAGARPLLPAGRRVVNKENTAAPVASAAAAAGGTRQRTRTVSTASATFRSSSQVEAGGRSARGGGGASMAHTTPSAAPLSSRRVAGASPSRKVTRRASEAAAVDGSRLPPPPPPPMPSSQFQQTHTGCPPPSLSAFGGSGGGSAVGGALRGGAAASARGPVSPIKRTSTACPSGAQVYPHAAAVAVYEDAALHRSPNGGAAAAAADPWLKPGAFSTPTNRDGGRESSEAPTVPYEGSTGQRASMSLSPRTDFDTMSVSGRLSYGM